MDLIPQSSSGNKFLQPLVWIAIKLKIIMNIPARNYGPAQSGGVNGKLLQPW